MNGKRALSLALLLLTPALAGGGGPAVSRPAGTTINPFGAAVPVTPVTLADLQRGGGVLTLVTGRNVVAATVRGPTVLLAAGSAPATAVVVTRGTGAQRYELQTPVAPGTPVAVGSVRLLPVAPVTLLPGQLPAPAPVVTPTPVTAPAAGSTTPPAATPPAGGATSGRVTICHRTGSATNPYTLLTVSASALAAHRNHGDIIPAPAGGCPVTVSAPGTTPPSPTPPSPTPPSPTPPNPAPPAPTPPAPPEGGSDNDKVTICHATGSETNPYNLITVSRNALSAHEGHGDIIPAPPEGCPTTADGAAPSPTPPSPTPPNPAPPSPTPPGGGSDNDKVTICHATGSANNPYNLITISRNALSAHEGHGDIIPAPPEGCPTTPPPGNGNGNGNGK
ncbi:hypothetical protein [Deinococcus aquaedulcis]|uniref:hypothetical protein n=1 Tax=Deinococcus aquaedulcis TaxID=2840455 RepID=UPI001C83DFB1|nr:hypothetical protein [Deinococcus aquaedulcis]